MGEELEVGVDEWWKKRLGGKEGLEGVRSMRVSARRRVRVWEKVEENEGDPWEKELD